MLGVVIFASIYLSSQVNAQEAWGRDEWQSFVEGLLEGADTVAATTQPELEASMLTAANEEIDW